jgi:hypothetical protein
MYTTYCTNYIIVQLYYCTITWTGYPKFSLDSQKKDCWNNSCLVCPAMFERAFHFYLTIKSTLPNSTSLANFDETFSKGLFGYFGIPLFSFSKF